MTTLIKFKKSDYEWALNIRVFWRPPNLKFNHNKPALKVIFTIRHLVFMSLPILGFLILQHLSLPFRSVMCVIR